MKTQKRRLMWHVALSPRATFHQRAHGPLEHLEGVMNGILLLALGVAWNELRLPHPVKVTAYCFAL